MEQRNHTCYAAVEVDTKIQILKQNRPSRITKRGITAKKEIIIQQSTENEHITWMPKIITGKLIEKVETKGKG